MQTPLSKIFPASPQQQGIWFHALSKPASYWNVVDFRSFSGILESAVIKKAFDQVISRHSGLRTNFLFQDDSLFQVIREEYDLDEIVEFSTHQNLGELKNHKYLESMIAEGENQVFDLQSGPLLSCKVIQFPSKVFILITMHHIIHDVASLQIFWQDLMDNYNLIKQGHETKDLQVPRQYHEYSENQHAYFQTEKYQAQKEIELGKLAEGIQDLNLGFYVSAENASLVQEERYLSKELVHDIRSFALKNRVVFSAVFQLAYFMLLREYSGKTSLFIANTTSGRGMAKRAERETMGLFANRLIHSLQIPEQSCIKDLLKELNKDIIRTFENNVPFEDLMRDSHFLQKHGLEKIQAGFNLIKLPRKRPRFMGLEEELEVKLKHAISPNSQYDIFLTLIEQDDEFRVRLDLTCEPEFQAMTDLMLDKYVKILETCLHQPETKMGDLALHTSMERECLTNLNDTQIAFPKELSFLDLFAEQVKKTPYEVALISGKSTLNYQELDQQSTRLARYLNKQGIHAESIVGICLERTPEMLIGILGILKAGGAFLPMDTVYPADWKASVLSDAGISYVLTMSDVELPLDSLGVSAILLDLCQNDIDRASCEELSTKPDAHALAYVIYTSGSTGKPKGVMIEHAALFNFLLSMKNLLNPTPGFSLLSMTTFSFDICYLELFLPLIMGGKVILANSAESKDGLLLHELITKYQPDFMQSTPSGWQMILDSAPDKLWGMQVLSGGEPIKANIKDLLFKRGAEKVWNLFGPTETTIWSTAQELKADEKISIGRPIGNTSIYILDKKGKPLPLGRKGYLFIGGSGLARGYLNRAKLTQKRFVFPSFAPKERLYFTGDIARVLPSGEIEFWGREDEQVKIRGHRVELGEIENILLSHDSVKACSVLANQDTNASMRLVAYVIPQENLNIKRLKDFLKQKLPVYMIPGVWIEMKKFPLTLNGKVDKKSLPDPDFNHLTHGNIHPPITEIQKKIAKIWQKLLNLKEIGIYDNFFEIGGHSLIATRVLAAIREEFSISIPIKIFFELKQIHGIAQYLELVEKVDQKGEYEVINI